MQFPRSISSSALIRKSLPRRSFVEQNFYKGTGAAQLLKRFNTKAIPELMYHTTTVLKHALLSSTQAHHLAGVSVGERK